MDYSKLAKQNGGTVASKVDYAALAKKAGGTTVSTAPVSQSPFNPNTIMGDFVDPKKPIEYKPTLGSNLGSIGQGISGTVKSVVDPVVSGARGFASDTSQAFQGGLQMSREGVAQIGRGNSPMDLVSGAGKFGMGFIQGVSAPLATPFKPVGKALEFAGEKLADTSAFRDPYSAYAPETYDKIQSGVEDVLNYSTIAGTVGGFMNPAGTINTKPGIVSRSLDTGMEFLKKDAQKTIGELKGTLAERSAINKAASQSKLVAQHEAELIKIEDNYSKLRKNKSFNPEAAAESRNRVAAEGVLTDSVNENGLLLTKEPGGAVEQYKAKFLDGTEGVVRKNLVNEGGSVSPTIVRMHLEQKIMDSGLEGAALKNALGKIDSEMEGLMLRARQDGTIPLEVIHDAKINATNNINFNTEPWVKSELKAKARSFKEIVENNSDIRIDLDGKIYTVKDINAELGKYLKDVEYLQSLDGARVKGGKLGKYSAQIAGNIAGGLFGNLVGGPVGSAISSVIGGEIASGLKGRSMARTFNKGIEGTGKMSPLLERASEVGNMPKPPRPNNIGMDMNQYREFLSRQGTQSPQYITNPTKNPTKPINASPINDTGIIARNEGNVNRGLPTQKIQPADLKYNGPAENPMVRVNDYQKDSRYPQLVPQTSDVALNTKKIADYQLGQKYPGFVPGSEMKPTNADLRSFLTKEGQKGTFRVSKTDPSGVIKGTPGKVITSTEKTPAGPLFTKSGERVIMKSNTDVPKKFVKEISKMDEKFGLSSYSEKEYSTFRTALSRDNNTGYAIKPDGDLVSVFNKGGKGNGRFALVDAIENGATKLDAFDGFLPEYYKKFGFEEYKRETNWTPGDPDVVYMKLNESKYDQLKKQGSEFFPNTKGESGPVFERNFRRDGRATGTTPKGTIPEEIKAELNQDWYHGTSQKNSGRDAFYSASEDVAGDYGVTAKAKPSELPKNPLIVDGSKETLAPTIGYKGDPLAEPKMPAGKSFDDMAKKYAQSKGHDSIIYTDGTFNEPELHVFKKDLPNNNPVVLKVSKGNAVKGYKFKDFADKNGYIYHATSKSNIDGIIESGLKLSKDGYQGKGVYFAPDEASTTGQATKEGAMIRVHVDKLNPKNVSSADVNGFGDPTEIVYSKTILPSNIEIKTSKGWEPLVQLKKGLPKK